MSYMTMTMFAPRIWGFDLSSPEARIARQAGWRRSDILWEKLMEAANAAYSEGDSNRAASLFRRAHWIEWLGFDRNDPRRITTRVNQSLLARQVGRESAARKGLRRARLAWPDTARGAIEAMQIAPRARSSLFHLRMEARHRETYHDNLRKRITSIAGETHDAICALETGGRPACRLYSRWRGEKPTVFDDTRKLLGACLLIMDPETGPDA